MLFHFFKLFTLSIAFMCLDRTLIASDSEDDLNDSPSDMSSYSSRSSESDFNTSDDELPSSDDEDERMIDEMTRAIEEVYAQIPQEFSIHTIAEQFPNRSDADDESVRLYRLLPRGINDACRNGLLSRDMCKRYERILGYLDELEDYSRG